MAPHEHAETGSFDRGSSSSRSDASSPPQVKVLRIIARLNVGGPARHVATLDDRLRRAGFDPLLVYGSVGPGEASLEDLVTSLGLRTKKVPELGRAISPLSDLRALWQVAHIVFREQPDIVHTHTAKAGALGRLAALAFNVTRSRDSRCAVVHTFHGHVFRGYFGHLGTSTVQLMERLLAGITDRVLTVSAAQRREIADGYRIAPLDKTDVIELGLELDSLLSTEADPRLRTELGFGPHDVVFGYVGRFAPIKNLPELIEAFALMAPRVSHARLMLVGDGDLRPSLERIVNSLGIAGRVRFAGWRRDVAAVHGSIDVAVLSSLNEGTPVALIEAMAAARPVIATAVGGVPDVVAHERSGLIVPAGDPHALAAAMERLAVDPDMRMTMGRMGRETVRVRFSSERLAIEMTRCYRDVLATKRSRRPS
jgi:glycosyltransferase involved in cell wall biosynthesis